MNHIICMLLIILCGCTTLARAQSTEYLWQGVTDKLQADTTNDNFFLLIGNESGTVYTFQKGTIDKNLHENLNIHSGKTIDVQTYSTQYNLKLMQIITVLVD